MFEASHLKSMVLGGSWIGQSILGLLLLMSSVSWTVIFLKWIQFRRIRGKNKEFIDIYQSDHSIDFVYQASQQLSFSPLAALFQRGQQDFIAFCERHFPSCSPVEKINPAPELLRLFLLQFQQSMESTVIQQMISIERRLVFLATISSAAPFIGLFGTVLGIIDSFQNIGTRGMVSLAVVAPGISEALVATAAGLLAAIPALVTYNYYLQQCRDFSKTMVRFSQELSTRMENQFYG